MVDITIHGDRVRFRVEGLDKLWALRSELDIPLSHVVGVEADPEQVGRWWHGVKVMGTDVPGLFAAGTFFYHGELMFWDVRHPEQTIIVSLAHERYKKLIVEVENLPPRQRCFATPSTAARPDAANAGPAAPDRCLQATKAALLTALGVTPLFRDPP